MRKCKLMIVVGARPNFIKSAPLLNELKKFSYFEVFIIHTGQHYDVNMSKIFFTELGIPKPDINLNVRSSHYKKQIFDIMINFENICRTEEPDMIVVVGDVNSTLAAALVASKQGIMLAHIEAGLRSFNMLMPEEINRIVADHLSDLLFAPSETAVKNLKNEGLVNRTYFSGDIMLDALLNNINIAETQSTILSKLKLEKKNYYILTLHRPYNVDDEEKLREIISAFNESDKKVIFPIHPRLKKNLIKFSLQLSDKIIPSEPLGYHDFLVLEKYARKIITDSGGIQKEAYYLKVPCITLRPETEWSETLKLGANVLVRDRKKNSIISALLMERKNNISEHVYGDGQASRKIVNILLDHCSNNLQY